MIYSMTGYGRAIRDGYTVEIRAVNHRYLDVAVRLPRTLLFLEETIKKRVSAAVSRGKLEVSLSYNKGEAAEQIDVSVNLSAAEGYLKAAHMLEEKLELDGELSVSALLRLPEVVSLGKADADEDLMTALITELTDTAVAAFNRMRGQEGERLTADILTKVAEIERLAGLAELRSPVTVAAYRARLTQKLMETLENHTVEEARILTEVAIFADKVSVDEETVRLRSHIAALRDMLGQGGTIGRKLDFQTQELSREANTIGSKGNDIDMSRIVVDMKTEIEKIREQVQNIE